MYIGKWISDTALPVHKLRVDREPHILRMNFRLEVSMGGFPHNGLVYLDRMSSIDEMHVSLVDGYEDYKMACVQ